jgi:hypothetical protein
MPSPFLYAAKEIARTGYFLFLSKRSYLSVLQFQSVSFFHDPLIMGSKKNKAFLAFLLQGIHHQGKAVLGKGGGNLIQEIGFPVLG